MTAQVLIVDDHPLTREALGSLLAANGFDVVGQAAGALESIELAGRLRPQLIVLDLTMPDMDGLQALPALRNAAPEAEVVVLDSVGGRRQPARGDPAGAAGYLLKSEPPERIVGFLRGVTQGEVALSGPVARRLLEQVREGGGRSDAVPESIASVVSARELEVLLLLDQHLGHRRDRAAADHLGAHRAFTREEPAVEARCLLAP